MFLIILVVVFVAALFLSRIFTYNVSVEFWERRGEQVYPFGDDKAKRKHENGITFIKFLKNNDDRFKGILFPNSKFLYKKKAFGKKVKFLIDGDEIRPFRMHVEENDYGVGLDVMPTEERIGFIQKMEQAINEYSSKSNKLVFAGVAVSFALIMLGFFWLFVIWQSNIVN